MAGSVGEYNEQGLTPLGLAERFKQRHGLDPNWALPNDTLHALGHLKSVNPDLGQLTIRPSADNTPTDEARAAWLEQVASYDYRDDQHIAVSVARFSTN